MSSEWDSSSAEGSSGLSRLGGALLGGTSPSERLLLCTSPSTSGADSVHPVEGLPPPILVRRANALLQRAQPAAGARRGVVPKHPSAPSVWELLPSTRSLFSHSPPRQAVLARLLEDELVEEDGSGAPDVFCGLRPPAIALTAYLERIFKYANCSPACYVLAYIYLERLKAVRGPRAGS